MHVELLLLLKAGQTSPTTASTPSTSPAITSRTIARMVLLLAPVIDALVVVKTVQRAEHLVAQIAHCIVQGLQVLLLLVPFQRQFRAQQLAAHVTSMARGQGQG